MLSLPNNCRAGEISVFPANWKTIKGSIRVPWRISYWFYDDNLKVRKKIVIKGMNELQTLQERQEAVKFLIDEEMDLIQRQGYNRVTRQYALINDAEISERTGLQNALDFAFKQIKAKHDPKIDIKSCLLYITEAIDKLGFRNIPIYDVKRRHLKMILTKCGELKDGRIYYRGKQRFVGRWTANTYNHYRKYLSALWGVLLDNDVVEANLVRNIAKQKTIQRIRVTLTNDHEKRKEIDAFLRQNHYSFWRFLQIFFHSGARITELLSLKTEDVDINGQCFKAIVNKGKSSREVMRPIKDVAIDLWKEVLQQAGKGEYLFSKGLKPGTAMIRREQITRRWKEHVKIKLGVTADFYSLKHTNLDEISAELSLQDAQRLAAHTTPVITMSYATNEKERQNLRIRKASNSFS
jgi:integrase